MDIEPLDLGDADAVAATFRTAAATFRECPLRRGNVVHLPRHGHLTITGDLHDHGLNFRRILQLASPGPPGPPGPVDSPERSDPQVPNSPTPQPPASEDRYLILHEVIHGPDRLNDADMSIRILARCADLKLRHPGHVHVVLSNHELAQLRGEGITKDGVSVVEAFDLGMEYLYGDGADAVRQAMNQYLLSLPLAVRCANGIMVSHSLPAPRRIEAFDTTILDREITEADRSPHGSVHDMVWGRHQNRVVTQELAEAWNVDVFVLGHQPAEMGYFLVAENTLVIASDHNHGVALSVDLSRSYTRDELVHTVRALASVMV